VTTLFIADLHLSAERPETIQRFLNFLGNEARGAEALYILGDLFEVWLGDDLIPQEYQPVIKALRSLNDSGTAIYVMHGNRDFLLGREFERISGCQLINDPLRLDLNGTPTLLMHGDLLCTDDIPYQTMRKQLRDPAWIDAFLAKPAEERITFARELRERSRRETGEKAETIMDVNPQAVIDILTTYDVTQLIHGHTHRPATHQHELSWGVATRHVLPEWNARGGALCCDTDGCIALKV
jgi:UDP-2,3-diacylglucosamine hydrolase